MTNLEKELLKALKAALVEWRKQTRLALEFGGEIAVNEGNAKAFTMVNRVIAKAEGRE